MKFIPVYILISCLIFSCKKEQTTAVKDNVVLTEIKPIYANGFSIHKAETYTKIGILDNKTETKDTTFYYLIPKKINTPKHLKGKKIIRTPVEKLIVCSTTDIPILEALEKENSLVGFPEPKYISSPKTRKRIDNKKVANIGSMLQPNIEKIISLNPEVIVSFSSENENKALKTLERTGTYSITNNSWLENHPLGRAEWIKLYGYLFNEEEKANTYFKKIETNYNNALQLAKKSTNKPSVLAGNLYKDVWYAPGGKSYVAKLINDANANYLWKNDNNIGSLPLSFESVFNKAENADIWIDGGQFSSINKLVAFNNKYGVFKATQHKKVYSKELNKGKTGGILYYEDGSLRPDLILKDLIKIFHPNLAANYNFHFYQKLK